MTHKLDFNSVNNRYANVYAPRNGDQNIHTQLGNDEC